MTVLSCLCGGTLEVGAAAACITCLASLFTWVFNQVRKKMHNPYPEE